MAEFMNILIKKLCITSIYLTCIIILFIILTATPALADSTVYGHVYDWSTFDVINYSIVVVDTVPGQKVVTTDGSYTMKVPKGNYTISATSGYGSRALYGYENISVQDNGEYKIDLLLFPDNNITALEAFGQNLPGPTAVTPAESGSPVIPGTVYDYLPAILGIAAILALGISGVVMLRRRAPATQAAVEKKHDNVQPPGDEQKQVIVELEQAVSRETEEPAQAPVPKIVPQPPVKPASERVLRPDCRSVIAVMERNGGRITQLDLRKALPYSEAKISLMISELEDAGYLKKIKRGRGNVLILNYYEESNGNSDQPRE